MDCVALKKIVIKNQAYTNDISLAYFINMTISRPTSQCEIHISPLTKLKTNNQPIHFKGFYYL